MDYTKDPRFAGVRRFEKKIWLSSPTMHGDEQKWVDNAIVTNWVSTVGENINETEKQISDLTGVPYTVGLASGTSALHLALRLAGEKLYGQAAAGHGTLEGRRVFASDLTFAATDNPVCYEGGIPVFIDTERDTWNMDPAALERAFELYPEVKLIVLAHLFGVPGRMDEIRAVADRHGALIVEDAAESLGSVYKGRHCGNFGDVAVISFNGNKIITGSSGGMLLSRSREDADRVRKWSTQSRDPAAWYQHSEMGYNYRMSNIIAGVIRGQIPYLASHIAQKKAIYDRYREGLKGLPVKMNPYDGSVCEPNFWLSCMIIDEDAMTPFERSDLTESWEHIRGKSCPGEILGALAAFNAEGRPIWKPMHLQPIYRDHAFVSAGKEDVGADIFRRGLCLPSDNKITKEEQDRIIDIIRRCFG